MLVTDRNIQNNDILSQSLFMSGELQMKSANKTIDFID